jgi:hypothetical protein
MTKYGIKEGNGDVLFFVNERGLVRGLVDLHESPDGKWGLCVGGTTIHLPTQMSALAFVVGHLSGKNAEGATFNGKTAEEFMEYASKIINP